MKQQTIFNNYQILVLFHRDFRRLGNIFGINIKTRGEAKNIMARLIALKSDPSPIQAEMRVNQEWFDFENMQPKSLLRIQTELGKALSDNFQKDGVWIDQAKDWTLEQNWNQKAWFLLREYWEQAILTLAANGLKWCRTAREKGYDSWKKAIDLAISKHHSKYDRGIREDVVSGNIRMPPSVLRYHLPAKEFVARKYGFSTELVDLLNRKTEFKHSEFQQFYDSLSARFGGKNSVALVFAEARQTLRDSMEGQLIDETDEEYERRKVKRTVDREGELVSDRDVDNQPAIASFQRKDVPGSNIVLEYDRGVCQAILADTKQLICVSNGISDPQLRWLMKLKFRINLDSRCFLSAIGVSIAELEEIYVEHKMRKSRLASLRWAAGINDADEVIVNFTYKAIFGSPQEDGRSLRHVIPLLTDGKKISPEKMRELKRQMATEIKNSYKNVEFTNDRR